MPQGSILGPLLFSIYIDDITKVSPKLDCILFADDSCMFRSDSTLHELITTINNELCLINKWVICNKLTLNVSKSHYMIFSKKSPRNIDTYPIKINNVNLSYTAQTKFLGLHLQSNLKWTNHIRQVVNKVNKYSAILYQIRNSLDLNSLKIIYNSLIYPCISYAVVIWGNSPPSHLTKLITSQKKIIRTIKYRDRFAHTNQDFADLRFLKFEDVVVYFSCIFTYKSLNNLSYPTEYFYTVQQLQRGSYSLRYNSILRPLAYRNRQSSTSPSIYCCSLWNDLPNDIRSRPSVASFKSALKQHLISKY